MSRYVFALVRCVPDPRTGEFVNVGAIAGDPDTGDWSVRQVGNESRVLRIADAAGLEAVHGFLARVQIEIDHSRTLLGELDAPLDAGWLQRLFEDHRNIVQLSSPAPIIADDAEQALDLIFSHMIIDPLSEPRRALVTKHRVVKAIRDSYQSALIDQAVLRPRVQLWVGEHVHAQVDFAVGNGRAVQLAQGWSFQRSELTDLTTQVKAWGFALLRLRDGDPARVVSADGQESGVDRDVDLQVVVALPSTQEQRDAYVEAEQVFGSLGVSLRDVDTVDEVGRRAKSLLGGH